MAMERWLRITLDTFDILLITYETINAIDHVLKLSFRDQIIISQQMNDNTYFSRLASVILRMNSSALGKSLDFSPWKYMSLIKFVAVQY